MPTSLPTPAPTLASPAKPHRLNVIDALRGFAILGILVVNVYGFSSPYEADVSVWSQPLDIFAQNLVEVLAYSKFYPLFSFLFGLGFALQLESATRRGTDFVPLFRQRMLILLAFGVLHVLFFAHSDILTVYALFGFVLLMLRNVAPYVLLLLAGAVFLVFGVLRLSGLDITREMIGLPVYAAATEIQLYREGSFGSIFWLRLFDQIEYYKIVLLVAGGKIFTMFLLGAWVGRMGVFREVARYRRWIWLAFGAALALTLVGIGTTLLLRADILDTSSRIVSLLVVAIVSADDLAVTSIYITGALLLSTLPLALRLLSPLEAVGRTALTNYILQSVICTTLFYGYGFGLYGTLTPAGMLVLALVIYLCQIIASLLWLRFFRMGPLEWVWRVLAYRERIPLRVAALPAAPKPQSDVLFRPHK